MRKTIAVLVIIAMAVVGLSSALAPSDVIQKKSGNETGYLDLSGVTVDFNSSAFAMEPLGEGRLTFGVNNTAELGINSTGTPSGMANF